MIAPQSTAARSATNRTIKPDDDDDDAAAAARTNKKLFQTRNQITQQTSSSASEHQQQQQRCAILLYGLPRAFQTLVLPSLIENVIRPNAAAAADTTDTDDSSSSSPSPGSSNNSSSIAVCDYFVYYHSITTESAGRSGSGGNIQIQTDQQLTDLLRAALQKQYSSPSGGRTRSRQLLQAVAHFTDHDFLRERGDLLHKIHTTTSSTTRHFASADVNTANTNNNNNNVNVSDLIYVPVKSDFGVRHFPTSTDNIVKMWHAQQGVWNLMEQHQQQQQRNSSSSSSTVPYTYSHVAMLRLDVVYMTPIRIFPTTTTTTTRSLHFSNNNNNNKNDAAAAAAGVVTIPAFAAAPVNDRMIYGPYHAVRVWAAERFQLLDQHIQTILEKDPGYGIHDEKYLYYTILPEIQRRGYEIQYDKNICFLRARADESIWVTDCGVVSWNRHLLETTILGYRCRATWLPSSSSSRRRRRRDGQRVVSLQCSQAQRQLPDDWSTNRPSMMKRFHHVVSQLKRRFGLAQ